MTPAHDDRDPERDSYLSEALRHAPDASIAAPAALSDAILRQARAAPVAAASGAATVSTAPLSAGSARRPAPARPHPFADFWAWLARPPVAAGFASVLAATLVGMMWWDRPMDGALPQAPPPQTAAPAAARIEAPAQGERDRLAESKSIPAPTSPAPAAPPTPESMAGAPAERRADKARSAPPAADSLSRAAPAAKDAAKRDTPTRAELPGTETARPAAPQPQPFPAMPRTAADEPVRERGAQTAPTAAEAERPIAASPSAAPPSTALPPSADSTAASKSAAVPMAAAPPPSPAAAPNPAPPALRDEPQAATEGLKKERARVAQADEPRALDRASRNATGAAAGALARAPERSDARAAASPLGRLRAAVGAEPQRWTWQRGADSAQPVDAALRNWLARVDTATGAANTVAARGDADAFSVDGAATLRLLRDGRMHATLRVDGNSVRIEFADDAAADRTMPLAPSTAAALRAAMPPADR